MCYLWNWFFGWHFKIRFISCCFTMRTLVLYMWKYSLHWPTYIVLKFKRKRVTSFSFLPPGLMKIKSRLYKQILWFHNGHKSTYNAKYPLGALALCETMVRVEFVFLHVKCLKTAVSCFLFLGGGGFLKEYCPPPQFFGIHNGFCPCHLGNVLLISQFIHLLQIS